MIETIFKNVNFGVVPIEDGGKQINLIDPQTGHAYLLPLVPRAVDGLMELLGMDNEELMEHLERKAAAAQLEVPGSLDGPPPGANGKLIDPTERNPDA